MFHRRRRVFWDARLVGDTAGATVDGELSEAAECEVAVVLYGFIGFYIVLQWFY